MLNFAMETARAAGHVLLEKFGGHLTVTKKGDINLVTEADLASEALIIERIRTHHPQHSVLAEESGDSVIIDDSRWKWIVDPLDGTTNYAHGYPCFCVTIALENNGIVVLGVTYDPTRDELFAAEKHQGASLNHKPMRVSDTQLLSESMLVTGFPYDISKRDNVASTFEKFLMNSRAVRRDGSAAIDLAYVACGRFDGFWEEGLSPWDVAAGILLIEEAGGMATGYDGSDVDIYSPPFCASNTAIHKEMLGILDSAVKSS